MTLSWRLRRVGALFVVRHPQKIYTLITIIALVKSEACYVNSAIGV